MSSKSSETQDRLIRAASELFALNGYHGTTLQDICGLAEANIAAVNYHFGSKDKLYATVWQTLWDIKGRQWDSQVEQASTPEDALKMFIRMRLEAALDPGEGGWLPRIIHWEMGHPTPLHDKLVEQYLRPKRARLRELLTAYLGIDLTEDRLRLAAFCLHAPLVHILEHHKHGCHNSRGMLNAPREVLIETMQAYALAGLKGVAASCFTETIPCSQ